VTLLFNFCWWKTKNCFCCESAVWWHRLCLYYQEVWSVAAIEVLGFISDFFTVIYINSCVMFTLKAKIYTFQNIRHETSSSSSYFSCPIYKSVTHQYIPLWEWNIVQTLIKDTVMPYMKHRLNCICLILSRS
jgi:hypothetical protein